MGVNRLGNLQRLLHVQSSTLVSTTPCKTNKKWKPGWTLSEEIKLSEETRYFFTEYKRGNTKDLT